MTPDEATTLMQSHATTTIEGVKRNLDVILETMHATIAREIKVAYMSGVLDEKGLERSLYNGIADVLERAARKIKT